MANEVRITGGKFKGRKIKTPGGGTHPMGERERIALFNMIGDYLPGAQVLDTYAGSGSLGIEALSREAKEVLFVEESHVAMGVITENCRLLDLKDEQVAFYRGSVSRFYKRIVLREGHAIDPMMELAFQTFPDAVDIMLADPPYDKVNYKEISRLANGYLKEGGILVLSHPGEAPDLPGLELLKTRQYAEAHLSIYQG